MMMDIYLKGTVAEKFLAQVFFKVTYQKSAEYEDKQKFSVVTDNRFKFFSNYFVLSF